MLKLTKKADYGLIALKHLAVHALADPTDETRAASTKEIADAYRIPQPLLAKILQKLTRTGILVSLPGTNGGYRLARDAKKISALEVIRAIDGPIILTHCFTSHGECDQSDLCTVREPLRKIHEGIVQLLNTITIADMAADEIPNVKPPGGGSGAGMEILHVL